MPGTRRLRVAALQVAFNDGESPQSRWARVSNLVWAHRNADLVVLPELWAHGAFSPATWACHAEALNGPLVTALGRLASETGVALHTGSIIELGAGGPEGRDLWNTAVMIGADGAIAGTYRKIHRFGFGEGEPLLLEAGDTPTYVDLPQGRAGLATCYDLRFPELFRKLVDLGSEVFIIPAAWPAPRRKHWQLLGQARAIENQAFVLQVNTVGTHGGVTMGGHSQVVDPQGRVLAHAGDTEEVLDVELDLTEVATYRRDFPVLADQRPLLTDMA